MKVVNHPEWFVNLREITPEAPLRILMSGCMTGMMCGVDGSDYGFGKHFQTFMSLPTVDIVGFCPEDFGLGTPRTMPDIHDGDGMGVYEGTAKVLDEHGADLTEGMVKGGNAMVEKAREHDAELCFLMDSSGACGTQVISLGCRFDEDRKYQMGFGVAAAALVRAGFPVVSQRDHKSFDRLMTILDPNHEPTEGLLDHHEHPWTVEYFGLEA